MRDATFSRRDMLSAVSALTIGAAFAGPLKAVPPSQAWADILSGFGDARGDASDIPELNWRRRSVGAARADALLSAKSITLPYLSSR